MKIRGNKLYEDNFLIDKINKEKEREVLLEVLLGA